MASATHSRRHSGEQGITIVIRIPAEEYLQFYRGVRQVSTISTDGQHVLLPAKVLRPFVTRDGISGTFHFRIDESGRLLGVSQLR